MDEVTNFTSKERTYWYYVRNIIGRIHKDTEVGSSRNLVGFYLANSEKASLYNLSNYVLCSDGSFALNIVHNGHYILYQKQAGRWVVLVDGHSDYDTTPVIEKQEVDGHSDYDTTPAIEKQEVDGHPDYDATPAIEKLQEVPKNRKYKKQFKDTNWIITHMPFGPIENRIWKLRASNVNAKISELSNPNGKEIPIGSRAIYDFQDSFRVYFKGKKGWFET